MPAPTVQQLVARDASRDQIEEWCRRQTQQYSINNAPYVLGRVLGKFLMYVSARDKALAPHLMLDGIWEPWITMAIARHVRPGMRCMDIGACYGYYSLLMADIVGTDGTVEAWEPVWGSLVETNAEVNGLPVKVHKRLMGTRTRERFTYSIVATGLYNAGNVPLVECAEDTRHAGWKNWISVATPDADPWDFIKIDVEGAEADVWEALAGVRASSPSLTVCMEFTMSQHPEPRAFLERIQADGFSIGTVGHDGVPRFITIDEALVPDTGDFRMLWLTR